MSLIQIILFLSFISNFGYCQGFNQKNDVQFWTNQRFEVELNERALLYLENEFRWGNSASELYFNFLQPGLEFAICEWLIVAPGYRHTWVLGRESRERTTIYNPLLDIFVLADLREWELENRVRIFYLIPESTPNLWLIRDRILLATPWEWGAIGFNPFMFDEVFFLEKEGFVQNRLAFGGSFELTELLGSELLYILRHIRFPNWRPNHLFVFRLFFDF